MIWSVTSKSDFDSKFKIPYASYSKSEVQRKMSSAYESNTLYFFLNLEFLLVRFLPLVIDHNPGYES